MCVDTLGRAVHYFRRANTAAVQAFVPPIGSSVSFETASLDANSLLSQMQA